MTTKQNNHLCINMEDLRSAILRTKSSLDWQRHLYATVRYFILSHSNNLLTNRMAIIESGIGLNNIFYFILKCIGNSFIAEITIAWSSDGFTIRRIRGSEI